MTGSAFEGLEYFREASWRSWNLETLGGGGVLGRLCAEGQGRIWEPAGERGPSLGSGLNGRRPTPRRAGHPSLQPFL